MYKIAVCDDISIEVVIMIDAIKRKAEESGIKGISYFTYSSGEDLLADIEQNFDVIFLDIHLKGMNGLEAAERVRVIDNEVIIVFCSGAELPTPSMFRVQPYRYIVKKYYKEMSGHELGEVLEKMVSIRKKDFFTMHGGVRYSIRYEDILYISLVKRGCEIWIVPESYERYRCNKIFSGKTVRQVYEILDDTRFAFVHNSYIINIQHIYRSSRTEVSMRDGTNLTIARSKAAEFRKRILEYSDGGYEKSLDRCKNSTESCKNSHPY